MSSVSPPVSTTSDHSVAINAAVTLAMGQFKSKTYTKLADLEVQSASHYVFSAAGMLMLLFQ
jgi:hypothetical protein